MFKAKFPPVPPEPAHPTVVKLFDDLVAILKFLRDKFQPAIDQAFDRASRELGFVVTTTVPIVIEVAERGKVTKIRMGSENLEGTLFDRALTAALKPLYETPLPADISAGTHKLYVLWYDALKLKLRTHWMEPAHVPQDLWAIPRPWQEPAHVPGDLWAELPRGLPTPWQEPAHWFDPGSLIAAEESVLITAIDEVYPELRLADRISSYRSRVVGAPGVQEPAVPLPGVRPGVNKQLVVRALTDPGFRKMLAVDPQKALGVSELSAVNEREVAFVLDLVKNIVAWINSLADQLLCANGGPCGIA